MTGAPLAGLRVVDQSVGIAGAYAAKLLSDAGARVVKVEFGDGDPLRRRGEGLIPPRTNHALNHALFEHLHEGHDVVGVRAAGPEDRRRLREMFEAADIVISGADSSNATTGVPASDIFEWNAGAVTVSLSPFGLAGPWADRPATEFTLQAWSGKTATNYGGYADRPPSCAGGEPGLWLAGAYAAVAALAYRRSALVGGTGVSVDVSILECMAAIFGQDVIATSLADSRAAGSKHGREIPSIHPAADGLVAFAIVTAQQWSDFCVMIERPDWTSDDELTMSAGRRRRAGEVTSAVEYWLGTRTVEEVVETAALFRIPIGIIANGRTAPALGCYSDSFVHGAGGFLRPRGSVRFPSTATAAPGHRSPTREPATGQRPLEGLRVADFTAFWAGPYAACLLALLGAQVIHVESPKRPDGMRNRSARPPTDETWLEWSSVFHLNNGSKQAISIDLDRADGLDLARRLIARSHGVIENFSPRVMERFGLDGAGVAAINPQAVYVRMPAFGLDNPWRDRPAFQHTIEPIAGLAWISGYPDRDPQPIMICDGLGGVHAAFGMLCGLEHRDRTGHGMQVEVRLSEVAAAIAAEQTVTASAHGVVLERIGNRHRWGGPQGVYACRPANGGESSALVALSVDSDEQWGRFRAVVGEPSWFRPELDTAPGRLRAAEELDRRIGDWCAGQTLPDVIERLCDAGVPVAEVCNGEGLLRNPQLRAREFLTAVAHPVCGVLHYPSLPMKVSVDGVEVPTGHRSHAPLIAEHDELIESLLDVDHDRLQQLREAGITGPVRTSSGPM